MMEWKECSQQKVIDPEELEACVLKWRSEGKTIATLNGSFDLLHAGHLYMIYEASKTADILLLALNSDRSIREYKGEHRPIISLPQRIEMITGLTYVDYVTWFDETNPCALIEKVRPNVHVNGVEYGNKCIEADVVKQVGARLHLVKRIANLATSDIIERITTCV